MMDSFQVKGQSIITSQTCKFIPKLPSRKIFNTKWFEPKSYEHEIANHYRDYKQQQNNRSHKRGFKIKKVIFSEQFFGRRNELPLKRIDFPQSILSKSQRKNCELPFLENIYNHTLQRVIAADSLCELKLLTNRHCRINESKSSLKSTKRTTNDGSSFCNKDFRTLCATRREKRHNLGHIGPPDSVDNLSQFENSFVFNKSAKNKVNEKPLSLFEFHEEINEDKDNYFLHLASECYNEGFLAHIKYLESIGERNAINNQISKRKRQNISEKNNTPSRPLSTGSNVSSSDSLEDPTNSTGVRKFILIVKRVLENRYIGKNPCNYDGNGRGVIKHDWKIRVNITRSSSPESLNYCQSPIVEFQDNINTANHCSMSEILNTNENQSQEISLSNASSVKHQHFHNLIENLSNLEISELGSLPKIVLTDFSTSNVVADSAAATPRARLSENVIIKQQSLDVEQPNLSDYSSEARPP